MAIRVCWGIWNPHFGGEWEVVGVSDGTFRKSDGSFLYRLSIVTVALSVTNRPQFAIECLRRSNQKGGDPSCWVAKSERPRLTNGEIIFEEFQPM